MVFMITLVHILEATKRVHEWFRLVSDTSEKYMGGTSIYLGREVPNSELAI